MIAFWLEAWLTKDEILSRYLSNVYFGDNVYGLRAASRHYFNREPEKLTLAQSAMLAGMVKAPSRLAPTRNLDARAEAQPAGAAGDGRHRRRSVAGARAAARARRGRSASVASVPTGTYFADWVAPAGARRVRGRLSARCGCRPRSMPTCSGWRCARSPARGIGDAQAALVAMRPDGRVVAMVGGKNYTDSPFNRATQARRQPGSAFKLFVYLAALRAGWTPDSMIEDGRSRSTAGRPANNDGVYRGEITLREAFARSSNAATVRLSERVGRANVIRAARDLGITTPAAEQSEPRARAPRASACSS